MPVSLHYYYYYNDDDDDDDDVEYYFFWFSSLYLSNDLLLNFSQQAISVGVSHTSLCWYWDLTSASDEI